MLTEANRVLRLKHDMNGEAVTDVGNDVLADVSKRFCGMDKPKHFKPGLYAMFFEQLKDIAREYGYNLLVHGSMNRDLDLVAVPWVDEPRPEQDMIKEFQEYLTGMILTRPNGK